MDVGDGRGTSAHRQATVILAHWLGKKSKQEAAEELEVKPLRIWQLSQMAVSGMVAGLLKQPRQGRARAVTCPEDGPILLRKRIHQLESEVKGMERLVQLIRDLPLTRAEESRGTKVVAGSRKTTGKRTRRTSKRRPGSDGNTAGRDAAHAAKLASSSEGGAAGDGSPAA